MLSDLGCVWGTSMKFCSGVKRREDNQNKKVVWIVSRMHWMIVLSQIWGLWAPFMLWYCHDSDNYIREHLDRAVEMSLGAVNSQASELSVAIRITRITGRLLW